MKNLSLFDLIIGIVTSFSIYNNAFCDDKFIPIINDGANNSMEHQHHPNITAVSLVNVANMFNVLHQAVNQFEQENDIANLEYNYKFEKYVNFRTQLGQIRSLVSNYIFDAHIHANFNQQNVNIPQPIITFNNYLFEYDVFLTARQMGFNMNEPILHLH